MALRWRRWHAGARGACGADVWALVAGGLADRLAPWPMGWRWGCRLVARMCPSWWPIGRRRRADALRLALAPWRWAGGTGGRWADASAVGLVALVALGWWLVAGALGWWALAWWPMGAARIHAAARRSVRSLTSRRSERSLRGERGVKKRPDPTTHS